MDRLSRVKRALLAHCLGNYAEMSVGACCDYISWLAKFRKLPQDDISFLATWACTAMGTLTADEEEAFWDEYRIRKEQGRI
jgi:hypothetical protein